MRNLTFALAWFCCTVSLADDVKLVKNPNAPTLGIMTWPLLDEASKITGTPPTYKGVWCMPDLYGPAGSAGMDGYSIVTRIGKNEVKDTIDVESAISNTTVGTPVEVTGFDFQDEKWNTKTWKFTPITTREYVLGSLIKKRIENGKTIYRHNNSPSRVTDGHNVFCYILRDDNGPPKLMVKMQAINQEIKHVSFSNGSTNFDYPEIPRIAIRSVHEERKHATWFEEPATEQHVDVLTRLCHADAPSVRISSIAAKRDIPKTEQYALRVILQAYELMMMDCPKNQRL